MLLSKSELALAKLASTEESRYSLTAIAVEKDVTVVTNGHYLVTVEHGQFKDDTYPVTAGLEHAQPNGKPILVKSDAALAALKTLPKKNTIPVLGNAALGTDGRVYTNTLDAVQSFESKQEGTFPNWQAVMPKSDKKPHAVIAFSAAYLRLLADFVDKYGMGEAPTVKLTVYGDSDSAKFEARTADGQKITAVLMPVRLDKTSDRY